MPITVGIIDFGTGNLRSVYNAVNAIGAEAHFVLGPEEVSRFDKLILPGVGAFGDAIARLTATGLADALNEQKEAGKSILGLCLGMQLMCQKSEEGGIFFGLGWFNAEVKRFPDQLNVKVPHIGWNNLCFVREHALFKGLGQSPDVYFVHSFRAVCENETDVLAWCDYGEPFAAVICKQSVCGFQFHPEKSQRVGLSMLKNFIEDEIC
ncbi:MAG: imidazole glycerol phosphate synthase subunit HisH [Desulfamplus sp.]|nr:imidazole glycerol phosphate synthase subunit HisH [Desulfamplus sp.]